MIQEQNGLFVLSTKNTTYAFQKLPSGHLEHLYYGKKITLKNSKHALAISQKKSFAPGNTALYSNDSPNFSLENILLEFSSYGKGDIWEPFIEIKHKDGSTTNDFLFNAFEINHIKQELKTLPSSYSQDGKVEHLCIFLKDKNYDLILELHYYVYDDCDIITRSARLINQSSSPCTIKRLMSVQLDFDTSDFICTTFHGAWAREMQMQNIQLNGGKFVSESKTGTSSSRANPFVMLSLPSTTQDIGDCYAINLIYSANHYEAVEVTSYGKTRFISGINPSTFDFVLEPLQDFEAPEAVFTFSSNGFNGASLNMQHFVQEHIVRGVWKNKARPILLNSWEAAYFNINEKKLLTLAKEAKKVGAELFVMDDGWFGNRNDDHSSLGDWVANKKKLPHGISGLCSKINALGLDFGIWVEPEMVNVNSNLYHEHPDWTIENPKTPHSEGRNQRILDLTKTVVQDFLIDTMSRVFSSANIVYVKWDMNRIFTDYYSQNVIGNDNSLENEKNQGAVNHFYVCGLYRCLKVLINKFPKILFEGCVSGGNRFDLGMLCYFPQIWASDNTDAYERAKIQTGYSYGYPMNTVSSHVSTCPNHQTLRITPLDTRFNVASFGVCGYESNLCDMKKDEKDAIKAQITLYKKWRNVLQFGDFYRGRTFFEGNITEWTCVLPDKTKAVGFLMQSLSIPNKSEEYFKARGLDSKKQYHFYNIPLLYNIKDFGSLINLTSPIHIKQDSVLENIASRIVHLKGETEDYIVYGDTLMNCGVRLQQGFAASGFSEGTRCFPDFASRLYFMEEVE